MPFGHCATDFAHPDLVHVDFSQTKKCWKAGKNLNGLSLSSYSITFSSDQFLLGQKQFRVFHSIVNKVSPSMEFVVLFSNKST